LEAPFLARDNPPPECQRRLRPSALGDVCLHDARFGGSCALLFPRLNKLACCKMHTMDLYCDHTPTCTAHSGATEAHDWTWAHWGRCSARPDTRYCFLQAHRETEAHFTATGMPSQRNNSNSFRFKRAAFFQSLKSKVGLVAAKAAGLRINLNLDGCGVVSPSMHAPSRASLLVSAPPSFTQSPFPPRSLVRDGQTSPHRPRLVVSHSTCPPLSPSPPEQL